MEIVRNSINIVGLADDSNIPERIQGQMIQYSESDTIFIRENYPEIGSIFQVIIKVTAYESRKIKTPIGNTIVLDGTKNLKIIYTQKEESGKGNFIDISLPFNTYIEVPKDTNVEEIHIYILDAYFDLLDERKIYSNLLYLINVVTDTVPVTTSHNDKNQVVQSVAKDNENDFNIPATELLMTDEIEELALDLEYEYL